MVEHQLSDERVGIILLQVQRRRLHLRGHALRLLRVHNEEDELCAMCAERIYGAVEGVAAAHGGRVQSVGGEAVTLHTL